MASDELDFPQENPIELSQSINDSSKTTNPSHSHGLFSNDTSCIRVTHNQIIFNGYCKDEDSSKCGILSPEDNNVNFLLPKIEITYVYNDQDMKTNGFEYDPKNDSWINNNINDAFGVNKTPGIYKRINFMTKKTKYVLIIGDTGVGKSSLVKLLTSYNDIKTSNGTDPCTKDATFYALANENLCFVDTRGLEDNDKKTNDTQILNNIQRSMHLYQGNKCQFIWIVKSANRTNKHLEQQAKFIEKFGSNKRNNNIYNSENNSQDSKENELENSDKNSASDKDNDNKNACKDNENDWNVWDSVLLIVSQPKPGTSLLTDIQGVIEFTKQYGCNDNHWEIGKNLYGFSNLSWIEDKSQRQFMELMAKHSANSINNNNTNVTHHGNLSHYYHSNEIKEWITNSLQNNIKYFEVFSLNYQCIKCGIIGDPNFVNDLKCHTKAIKCHPNEINNIKYTHLSDKPKQAHQNKEPIPYHPQRLQRRRHSYSIGYKHATRPVLSIHGKIAIGTLMVLSIFFINGFLQDITDGFASILTKMGYKSCAKYPCCGGDINSQGCIKYCGKCGKNISTYLRPSSGCIKIPLNEQKYKCCNNNRDNIGCQFKYACCNKDTSEEKDNYCIIECEKCNKDVNSNDKNCGFEMKCCGFKGLVKNRNDLKDGCDLKCQACNAKWGCNNNNNHTNDNNNENDNLTQQVQGCSCDPQYKHDMQMIKK